MSSEHSKQTSWRIIYSDFSGAQRKAVEFLSREAGKYLIRETGVYSLYVLGVEAETSDTVITQNAFIIGKWEQSKLIQKFVKRNEIPKNGYLLRVTDNPDTEDCSLVIITAESDEQLFYGAAAFTDVYIPSKAPNLGGLRFAKRIFDKKLPVADYSHAPQALTRSIFTWGHVINDYREYIEAMARQGLNQLILWNDFKPVNADEIVEYAHAYGIELIWGFAWGWINGCENIPCIDDAYLEKVKANVISVFEKEYAACGDGIYFQSFTERLDDSIGGRSIADTVTDFVNSTASELWKNHPDLKIQFGLHATSVKDNLDAIARVDKRIEIIWENGGVFPFDFGNSTIEDPVQFEKDFLNTLKFTERILKLRGTDALTGIAFKGFMKLDWQQFKHQSGAYVLGNNAKEIKAHDRALRDDSWRIITANWLKNGEYALRLARHIRAISQGNVNLNMAGTFDGGTFLPQAVCAEIFKDCDREYSEILRAAMNKDFVIIN